ncbi:FAS1-like dehydratase domain-containing protein [Thioclava sp. FR2]|uniref:FAS1-like dehydratase domain-containing protein n=1 Tax=Thioclava sp. FR2 TaxID=3445780 RepID=UPI003EBC6522
MQALQLADWIGRSDHATETLSPSLVERFLATMDRAGPTSPGQTAPLLIHLCLAPPVAPMLGLGRDGHPAKGGFLPPVALPRRMWAGGSFAFHDDLHIGETLTRRSTIRSITEKQGRTGPLCFVTVEHQITSPRGVLITETQDLVFRGEASEVAAKTPPPPAATGQHQRSVTPTPTLLFRYSALTFNGHRIHYDAPYARQVEGYGGLVVHGPLIATLLCQFAADLAGQRPATFRFRGLTPLFDDQPFLLHADATETGFRLWAATQGGPVAMEAEASIIPAKD